MLNNGAVLGSHAAAPYEGAAVATDGADASIGRGRRKILPQPADVLGGRGQRFTRHNCHYQAIIKARRAEYDAAGNEGKRLIRSEIVRCIRKLGGRFLRPKTTKKTTSGGPPHGRQEKEEWVEMSDAEAQEKVALSIRNKRRNCQQQQQQKQQQQKQQEQRQQQHQQQEQPQQQQQPQQERQQQEQHQQGQRKEQKRELQLEQHEQQRQQQTQHSQQQRQAQQWQELQQKQLHQQHQQQTQQQQQPSSQRNEAHVRLEMGMTTELGGGLPARAGIESQDPVVAEPPQNDDDPFDEYIRLALRFWSGGDDDNQQGERAIPNTLVHAD